MPADFKLTKKLGPLPVWAWGAIAGGALLWYYRRSSSSADEAATSDELEYPVDTTGAYAPTDGGAGVGTTTGGTGATGKRGRRGKAGKRGKRGRRGLPGKRIVRRQAERAHGARWHGWLPRQPKSNARDRHRHPGPGKRAVQSRIGGVLGPERHQAAHRVDHAAMRSPISHHRPAPQAPQHRPRPHGTPHRQ